MKRTFIVLFLLVAGLTAMAQDNYITLRGRITDRETHEALPAVAVFVAGQAIYTQTNADGDYVLKVPVEHASGNIVYALMGYLRDTVAVATVRNNGDRQLCSDGGRWLKEVVIKEYSPATARQLLIDAVNRIPQNYQTDSTVGTWFYRDVREMNDELFVFDEMVFDALRVGYDKHHTLKRLLNKSRDGYVTYAYKRPIESNYTAIRHDRLLLYDTTYVNRVTKGAANAYMGYSENEVLYDPLEAPNTISSFSTKKLEKRKNLHMRELTDADGKEYYVVYWGHADTNKYLVANGTFRVTIAKGSLAIVRIEEESYFGWVKLLWPLKGMMKKYGVKTFGTGNHTIHTYGMVNGRYTLTSYTRDEVFDLFLSPNSSLGDRDLHMNKHAQCVLTTETRDGASTFLADNTIQAPGSILINQRRADNKQYDEAFWQQYNFIPLEASVRQKLEKKLKKD